MLNTILLFEKKLYLNMHSKFQVDIKVKVIFCYGARVKGLRCSVGYLAVWPQTSRPNDQLRAARSYLWRAEGLLMQGFPSL